MRHEKTVSQIRLYCFSYAGGSALVYKSWQKFLPASIVVHPVELPGHTMRMREPLLADYDVLLKQLTTEVAEDFRRHQMQSPDTNVQYAMYGHCSGAPLSFAMAHSLTQVLGQAPLRCFFAASDPPHMPLPKLSHLDDEAFVAGILELGGTPAEFLTDTKLTAVFLPILRADMSIGEACQQDRGNVSDVPFTLFAPASDPKIHVDHVWEWEKHSRANCRRVLVDGDHFHALRFPQELIPNIRGDLMSDLAAQSEKNGLGEVVENQANRT